MSDDIFENSGMSVAGGKRSGNGEADKSIDNELYEGMKEVKTWADLKSALKNEHAARMHKVLMGLNGKNFVETYMKLIEYVEPKVIRKDNKKNDEVDRRIQISIKRGRSA